MLDLVIVGAAAAGCSSAIYAARRKLNFAIITKDIGGEVALSGEVNNWPGIETIQGFELAQNFAKHVKSYGIKIDEGWEIEKITKKENYFILNLKNAAKEEKEIETKSVIISTGINPRRLGIPGENEFFHKGVTYCTVCDGPLFKDKITATVGAGNSGLESAIMMSGIAKKVYLLTNKANTTEAKFGFPKGDDVLIEKVKSLQNVKILYQASSYELFGTERVKELRYEDVSGKHILELDGVMVHIGMIPNSNFIDIVEKDNFKQIIVNHKCQTNIPGIFAAGDVTNVAYKQIGIAVGQGITAALASIEYLNKLK